MTRTRMGLRRFPDGPEAIVPLTRLGAFGRIAMLLGCRACWADAAAPQPLPDELLMYDESYLLRKHQKVAVREALAAHGMRAFT